MITASKAFIAFCLLAVGGTVLVIGPTELRRMLPGGATTEMAAVAKPESKPEVKLQPNAEAKVESKLEPKAEPKPQPKAEEPKLAAPAPATTEAPKASALAET